MGLDLVPMGRPKPEHVGEWQHLMEPLYRGEEESDEQGERRNAISILPYEAVGAPRVGEDPEADRWALSTRDPDSAQTDKERLDDLEGFYVLRLVKDCDGLPNYTHAGMYDGVDETCFRGAFLNFCEDILDKGLLDRAWTPVMRPTEAVEYGTALSKAADEAEARGEIGKSWLRSLLKRRSDDMSFQEKIDILRSAGRWYVFWGKLGHPINAWF
ncbi:MAG: hypothetical protein AB7S41_16450 [Parvibaculaceae bacterium]